MNVGQIADRLGFYPSKPLTTSRIGGDVDMQPVIDKMNQASRDWHVAIDYAAKQMTAAHEAASASLQSVGRFEDDLEQQFIDATKKLAGFGWTVPSAIIPREFFEISASHDRTTVDARFVDFHRRAGCVRSSAMSSVRLARWRPLLRQCLDSHGRGDYLICVPALITALEGAIAFPEGIAFVRGSERRAFFNSKIADCLNDLLTRALWESMDIFVSNLFEQAPFDAVKPLRLNRHWILHGRDTLDWTEADVLRLFQALDTLGLIFG